jgi:maltose O-acetyltransferase
MIRKFLDEFLTKYKMKRWVKLGLDLGKNVFIGDDVLIDPSFPWLISIGDACTLTSRVIILAHDASTKRHIGYSKIGRVSIGSKTFVGVGSIILPNVKIGENVIIGAGSVVTKDIPNNSIAVGNPAVVVGFTSDYISRHEKNMTTILGCYRSCKSESDLTEQDKKNMNDALQDGIGYSS